MQLKQVFMNLLVNAFQAIEEKLGGRAETGLIRLRTEAQEGRVVISVSDTGAGISPGEPGAHLRSLLHHQEGRGRNRARALDLLQHRASERRNHPGREPARPGQHLPGRAPARRGRERGCWKLAGGSPCSSSTTSRASSRPSSGRCAARATSCSPRSPWKKPCACSTPVRSMRSSRISACPEPAACNSWPKPRAGGPTRSGC